MGASDYLLQKPFVSTGSGFAYGPVPLYATPRMEGDNLNGSLWAANGLTGWLYPVTLQESFAQCPACAEQTMHVGNILGRFSLDPYGRTLLRAKVAVHDANHSAVGDVAVDASVWSPVGGPYARTRLTKAAGWATFPWGSKISGAWHLCVDNLTKTVYTYNPADNDVPACAIWNN